MGVEINADLSFGFFDPELPEAWLELENEDDEEDYEPQIFKAFGITLPPSPCDCGHDYGTPEYRKISESYLAALRTARKLVGCSIYTTHTLSDSITQLCLDNKGLGCGNKGGDETNVAAFELNITQEDIDTIKRFCEVTGIKYKEPKWYLTSYYS